MKKILKRTLIGIGAIIGVAIVVAAVFMLYIYVKTDRVGYHQKWSDELGTAYRNIRYGQKERNVYDLFIPAKAERRDSVALMLYVHGGSWTGGNKEDIEYECCNAARNGYLSAALNYTLVSEQSGGNIMAMTDEIHQCVAHIKQETERLGYKVSKMSIGGVSAGGHLAMLYAYSRGKDSPIPVAFVVDQVGPADLTIIFQVDSTKIEKEGADALVSCISGAKLLPDEYDKHSLDSIILAASPVSYVDSLSAPTLMAYGAEDGIVKQPHSERLKAALKRYGIEHEFYWFPHSNHALYGDPDMTEKFHQAITAYSKKFFGY